jgi:hypothetical protein
LQSSPPARSRCLEDLRLGNQSTFIDRTGNWNKALIVLTINIDESR